MMPETMLVENEKFCQSFGGISDIQMFGTMIQKSFHPST